MCCGSGPARSPLHICWHAPFVRQLSRSGAVRSRSAPPSNGGEGMPLVQHLFLLTSHNPQFPFPFPGRQTSIRLSSASNCRFSFTPPPHPRTFRFSHSVQYSSLSTTSFTSISSQIANVIPARPSGAFHHVPRPTEQTLGSTQPIFVVRIFVADPRIDVGSYQMSRASL